MDWLGMVHTQETWAGGSLCCSGQPGLHSETLSQKFFLKVWVWGAVQLVQRSQSEQGPGFNPSSA